MNTNIQDLAGLALKPTEIISFVEYYDRLYRLAKEDGNESMEIRYKIILKKLQHVIDMHTAATILYRIPGENQRLIEYTLESGRNMLYPQRNLQLTEAQYEIIEDAKEIKQNIEAEEKKLEVKAAENNTTVTKEEKNEVRAKVIESNETKRANASIKMLKQYIEQTNGKYADKNDAIVDLTKATGINYFIQMRKIAATALQYGNMVSTERRMKSLLTGFTITEIIRFIQDSMCLEEKNPLGYFAKNKYCTVNEKTGEPEEKIMQTKLSDINPITQASAVEFFKNREIRGYMNLEGKEYVQKHIEEYTQYALAYAENILWGSKYKRRRDELRKQYPKYEWQKDASLKAIEQLKKEAKAA